ncbi:MAG: EamA family transporter [Acidobacteria bacterium]|nr:EamA family transporter [Acidobacteriota bacterium]
MPSSRTLCRLAALGAAVLFSTGGAAIKATTLTSWQVASFRSGIAALAVLALAPAARRDWSWRAWLAGAAYAATLITFVLANKLTTSANAVFLQSTGPLYLLALSPLLLKERVRAREVAVMALMALGMALVLFSGQRHLATAPDPARGNMLGAASGLTWAFTLVSLRWLSGSAMTMVVAGNVVACLAALPQALPLLSSTATDWLVLGYLGIVQVGLAYWLMSYAVKQLPALEVSLLVLAEPALNPVWTVILHGERPAPWAILGGALILAATLANLFRRAV